MWRWVAIGIIGISLYGPAVQAQSDRQERGEWLYAQRGGSDRADERRRDRRGEERENRRERERPQREMLSPDERRELNRDLQRANREIYRRGRER